MRLRLSTYLAVLYAAATVAAFAADPTFGWIFAAASVFILLPVIGFSRRQEYAFAVLLVGGGIFVTHFVRAVLLRRDLSAFQYANTSHISEKLLTEAVLQVGIYGLLLLLGLVVGMSLAGVFRRRGEGRSRERRPVLIRLAALVTLGSAFVLVVRAGLQFGLGLGVKTGEIDPGTGFLVRLIPDHLIYPLAALYLIRYRHVLPPVLKVVWWLIVVGSVGLTLLAGSRSFLLSVAICVFIYFTVERGDLRLRLSTAVGLAAVGILVVVLSFAVANPLRSVVGQRGYSLLGLQEVAARVIARLSPDELARVGDLATRRIAGKIDGVVAIQGHVPGSVDEAFSIPATGSRIIGRMLPLYHPETTLSTGKAVAMAYSGQSFFQPNAGNLGLFAALQLAGSGRVGGALLALTLGSVMGCFLGLTLRIESADVRFLLLYVGAVSVFGMVESGNLDNSIPSLIMALAHLVFYGGSLLFIAETVGSPVPRRGRGLSRDGLVAAVPST